MIGRGLTPVIVFLLLAPASPAGAQADASLQGTEAFAGRWRDLALTEDSEVGFRRFMRMAQEGTLGDDVAYANVGVFKNHARVELVRRDAPAIVLFLTPRRATGGKTGWSGPQAPTPSRAPKYFTVERGANATSDDVARVARALDEAFDENPYELAYDFFNAPPRGAPLPGLSEAWERAGWRGVARNLARRAASLASLSYTIGVLVLLAAGLGGNVVLLWVAGPPENFAANECE